jgi:acetyl-CoA carboxylase alpha subunit
LLYKAEKELYKAEKELWFLKQHKRNNWLNGCSKAPEEHSKFSRNFGTQPPCCFRAAIKFSGKRVS